MLVQLIKPINLPDGTSLPAGAVVNLPDSIAAEYIKQGVVRERTMPGPTEIKELSPLSDPTVIGPGSILSFENEDNFVRNLVTVANPASGGGEPTPVQAPHGPRSGAPILTLSEVKTHLRIELESTEEDDYLTALEAAARRHAENVLRYALPAPEETPPNVKQAMLFLIAHFYRTREAIITGTVATTVPLAFMALLYPERDFTYGY